MKQLSENIKAKSNELLELLSQLDIKLNNSDYDKDFNPCQIRITPQILIILNSTLELLTTSLDQNCKNK